jgi:mono/diheme cytochrome c family protein
MLAAANHPTVESATNCTNTKVWSAQMRNFLLSACCAIVIAACASTQPPPDAQRTFATHCASCHGVVGEGDGPMVQVMRVNVPNLRQLSARNNGVFPADEVAGFIDGRNLPVSHGDRVMPVWGDVFDTTSEFISDAQTAQERIDGIVEFLRDLQYE